MGRSRWIALMIVGVLVSTSRPAIAAGQLELKFVTSTDLPAMGLRVNLMPRSDPSPLPPARTYTYTFQRGDERWKSEMYDPHELWVRTQHEGRWEDEDGNILVLATMRSQFPGPFEREHVTREGYEKAVVSAGKEPVAWNATTIKKWITSFTGAPVTRSQAVRGAFFRLANLVRFELGGKPSNTLAYAFRMKAPGGTGDWMFALCEPNAGIPLAKSVAAMEDSFFGKISAMRAPPARAGSGPGSFRSGRLRADEDLSPQFLESKRTAMESIRNMKGWWHAETKNYVFLSNLGLRHGTMVKDLQRNIELLRAAYASLVPARVEIDAVSVVRIFATSEEYLRYMGKEHEWSGGMWVPDRKELVIRPIDWGGSKDQRDRVFEVTYHEAFHQYVFYALDQVQTSVWFNEGHAELFAGAKISNGQLVVEESDRRWEEIKPMVESLDVPIDELLQMNHQQFYDKDEEKRRQNYALAWAMVYYLRKGAPLERPPRNVKILERYVDALWETRDPVKATSAAFEEVSVRTFEREFLAFWGSRNRRSTAKRNRIFKGQALRPRAR